MLYSPHIKKLFILSLAILTFSTFAQKLPDTYPKYYFAFEEADSIPHQPIYEDWALRDSLKRSFGRGNRHREALAVEKYEIEKQQINFLERQEQNNKHWNIVLVNGETIELKISKYSQIADYAFEHYYKELELIVFRQQWYEGNGYLILNRKTGKKYLTIGPPIISPNNKFFVAIKADLEAQYSPNGIQLFEIGEEIVLKLDYRIKQIGPSRVSWTDDMTFLLEAYTANWTNGLKYDYQHYKVAIKRTEP